MVSPDSTDSSPDSQRLDIQAEPRGREYEQLLRILGPIGSKATLVIRSWKLLDSAAIHFIRLLDDHDLKKRHVSAWPGTQLKGSTAELLEFDFRSALPLLLKSCGNLYSWIHPSLPEDLAVYRMNGEVCLLSCSHEQFSELHITKDETRQLLNSLPSIQLEPLASAE